MLRSSKHITGTCTSTTHHLFLRAMSTGNINPNDPLQNLPQDSPLSPAGGHGLGVFQEKENDDIKFLVDNFTSPALARALRVREQTLQLIAHLHSSGNTNELNEILTPFLKSNVDRRRNKKRTLNIESPFSRQELVYIQRFLQNMPRDVFQAARKRASVVIPLCNVNGIASVLFERRSAFVRTHKQQVCFPGGMVDEVDSTIIQTSLREMEEELGISQDRIEVLGILRCNWEEVASMTGIAVTPVVGFVGDINEFSCSPNPAEVERVFTVPLSDILDEKQWILREFSAPVFTGGPFVIWGLTAFLLHKFVKDVIMKCNISSKTNLA